MRQSAPDLSRTGVVNEYHSHTVSTIGYREGVL
nr:MAG TPA: hypothetical protein [Bacteriophage sp.]